MRFLFIAPIPFFYERGACIRSLNLVSALSGMGHEIDILTYPVGRDVKIRGVKTIRVETKLKPPLKAKMTVQRILTDCLLYRKALCLVKTKKYGCIIGKTPIGRIIGRKLKEKTGLPLIIDVVEPALGMVSLYSRKGAFAGRLISKVIRLLLNPLTSKFLRNLELKNYNSADVVLANWDLVKEDIEKESKRECVLLYDTVPDILRKRPKGDIKKGLGIRNEKVLLYTGASTPQQGIDVYIDCLSLLKHKNVKLVIVGPKEERYAEMVKRKGLINRVIFTGKVNMEELPKYFKSADILLTAYSTGGRNATVKLLFYLFQGKPIIASDVPQYTQIVSNDVVFLSRPTAEDFAEKVDYLLAHPKEAGKRAEKALQYANKKFSKEAYVKRLKRVLSLV
jgi:glycosyltransferase involved in cell wall biosynthesis